ncbi:MAG: hypothetical protein H7X94_02915 [Vallitaleaceae bacterium]|nr:hypothetical protein [Vallitaleaceae bacterium]
MKKLIKSTLFLAVLSAIGYCVYKFSTKLKTLKEQYENCIFFDGKSLKFEGEEFTGGSYGVMFGGLDMDFTGAILEEDATIDIHGEFCGVSIKVPADWQVKVEGTSERAGVSNTTAYDDEDAFTPVLYIKYHIQYAGLEIKYVE